MSGALLVLLGSYVDHYGLCELHLFNLDADPSDPVVDAAGKVANSRH